MFAIFQHFQTDGLYQVQHRFRVRPCTVCAFLPRLTVNQLHDGGEHGVLIQIYLIRGVRRRSHALVDFSDRPFVAAGHVVRRVEHVVRNAVVGRGRRETVQHRLGHGAARLSRFQAEQPQVGQQAADGVQTGEHVVDVGYPETGELRVPVTRGHRGRERLRARAVPRQKPLERGHLLEHRAHDAGVGLVERVRGLAVRLHQAQFVPERHERSVGGRVLVVRDARVFRHVPVHHADEPAEARAGADETPQGPLETRPERSRVHAVPFRVPPVERRQPFRELVHAVHGPAGELAAERRVESVLFLRIVDGRAAQPDGVPFRRVDGHRFHAVVAVIAVADPHVPSDHVLRRATAAARCRRGEQRQNETAKKCRARHSVFMVIIFASGARIGRSRRYAILNCCCCCCSSLFDGRARLFFREAPRVWTAAD